MSNLAVLKSQGNTNPAALIALNPVTIRQITRIIFDPEQQTMRLCIGEKFSDIHPFNSNQVVPDVGLSAAFTFKEILSCMVGKDFESGNHLVDKDDAGYKRGLVTYTASANRYVGGLNQELLQLCDEIIYQSYDKTIEMRRQGNRISIGERFLIPGWSVTAAATLARMFCAINNAEYISRESDWGRTYVLGKATFLNSSVPLITRKWDN